MASEKKQQTKPSPSPKQPYDDATTRLPGSPVETKYKHNDLRRLANGEASRSSQGHPAENPPSPKHKT